MQTVNNLVQSAIDGFGVAAVRCRTATPKSGGLKIKGRTNGGPLKEIESQETTGVALEQGNDAGGMRASVWGVTTDVRTHRGGARRERPNSGENQSKIGKSERKGIRGGMSQICLPIGVSNQTCLLRRNFGLHNITSTVRSTHEQPQQVVHIYSQRN